MKKTVFFLMISGLSLAACSGDDNNDSKTETGCLTCSLTVGETTDSDVVCNEDGIAIEDGNDTEVGFDEYIEIRRAAGYTCQ